LDTREGQTFIPGIKVVKFPKTGAVLCLATVLTLTHQRITMSTMRTTLNIEEDALLYAKERARVTGKSLGEVVSEALRETAQPRKAGIELSESGLPYIAGRAGRKAVTGAQVAEALDREEMQKHAVTRR
jgi:hypothetical protein